MLLDALGGAMIDSAQPIDWQHPLNNGLIVDLTITNNPGWRGGKTVPNLVRGAHTNNNGTLAGNAVWQGNRRIGGWGSISSGTTGTVNLNTDATLCFANNARFTCAFWYCRNGTNAFGRVFSCENSGGTEGWCFQMDSGGGTIQGQREHNSSYDTLTGVAITTGVWNFHLLTYDGTNLTQYLNDLNGSTIASASVITSASITPTLMGRGGSFGVAGFMDSLLIYNRWFNRQEASNLFRETKLGNPNRLRYISTREYSFPSAGGGGTPYTKSLTGTITPSATISKAAAKPLAGTSTLSALYTKAGSKPLAGTTTPSGALAKAVWKPLAGTATPSGSFVKAAAKSLTGTVTATGAAIIRACGKGLSGTATITATLAKAAAKPLLGSSTLSAACTRAAGVAKSGATAISAALAKAVAAFKSGATTPTGAIAKAVSKPLAGSLTPSGSASSLTGKGKTFSGTASLAAAFVRACSKGLAGTTTLSATLAKAITKGLVGAMTLSGSLVRSSGKAVVGTLTTAGSTILKAITKGFTGLSSLTGLFSKLGGAVPIVVPGGIIRRAVGLSRVVRRRAATLSRIIRRTVGTSRIARRIMAMGQILWTKLPKDTDEAIEYIFDFSGFDEAQAGEILTAVSVPAVSGLTIGTQAILSADTNLIPKNLGAKVLISGGTVEVVYDVECRGTFTSGAIRVVKLELTAE